MGRTELAGRALESAQRLAPNSLETRLAIVSDTSQQASDERYHLAQALVNERPNDPEALWNLGSSKRARGLHIEGLADIERAFALDPLGVAKATNVVSSLTTLRRFAPAVAFGEKFKFTTEEAKALVFQVATARYELDGDSSRFLKSLIERPLVDDAAAPARARFITAKVQGDLAAAYNSLLDPSLNDGGNIREAGEPNVNEIVELVRATLAFRLGKPEASAAHATKALAWFDTHPPTGPSDRRTLARAQAEIFLGRTAAAVSAVEEIRARLEGRSGYFDLPIIDKLGQLQVLLGQKEQALATLRRLMTGPNPALRGPRLIRLDPCWSLLATDPRFEEILKAAKPL
jgi:tetratricopeptide (TPR) repeat protein